YLRRLVSGVCARVPARSDDAAWGGLPSRGELWGLPLSRKCLALFYRTDRVAHPPATTDELFAMAPAARARGAYPLAYASSDLYDHAPWLHGMGGVVLGDDGAGHIATPAAGAALEPSRRFAAPGG